MGRQFLHIFSGCLCSLLTLAFVCGDQLYFVIICQLTVQVSVDTLQTVQLLYESHPQAIVIRCNLTGSGSFL